MSKHTAGPWHREAGQMVASMGRHVCDVMTGNVADARLIAAAPDLVEALREIVENAPGSRRPDWLEHARAALAKAGVRA